MKQIKNIEQVISNTSCSFWRPRQQQSASNKSITFINACFPVPSEHFMVNSTEVRSIRSLGTFREKKQGKRLQKMWGNYQ